MYCEICGKRPAVCRHHLLFGVGIRCLAEEDSLVLNLCNECHNMGKVGIKIHDTPVAENLSKKLGQAIWERNFCSQGGSLEDARKEFIRRYRKSYL